MFTSIDKAIVAVLGGAVTIAAAFGLDLGIGEAGVTAIGSALSAFLVWLVPNKVSTDTTE